MWNFASISSFGRRWLDWPPGLPVLSEEMGRLDPAKATPGSDLVAVLDPIDGTRSLIEQTDAWHCSLAICERWKPKLGLVYQPGHRATYDSAHTKTTHVVANNGGVVALSASAIQATPELVARLKAVHLQPTPVAHAVEKIVSILDDAPTQRSRPPASVTRSTPGTSPPPRSSPRHTASYCAARVARHSISATSNNPCTPAGSARATSTPGRSSVRPSRFRRRDP